MTVEEYYSKQAEVLNRFGEHADMFGSDPVFTRIVEAMIRGLKPEDAIVTLVIQLKNARETIKRVVDMNGMPTTILINK